MTYSIGIVAHIDRATMAHELAAEVLPEFVSLDDGTRGCPGNHAYVQSHLASAPGWSVILEEDAIPLHDFRADLQEVLELTEQKIVGLYLGTGYPAQWQRHMTNAIATDACFLVSPRLLHAVGYAIHPDIKRDLAGWMSGRGPRGPGMAPDDGISIWAAAHGELVAHTNPSLVDHRDTRTVIRARSNTFAPGRNRARKAHNTNQRLTWTDSAVTMGRTPANRRGH